MRLLTRAGIHVDFEQIATQCGKAVLTVLLAWVVYLLLRRAFGAAVRTAAERVADASHRQRLTTLLLLVNSTAKYAVIFCAAIMVLGQLSIDTKPVLAAAGIVGLAVGFGAQNLVRDVVSGFFIIMEGQYGVGDLVEINGAFGQVEEVGLRITKLRDPSGQLRHFPNGAISTANNYTQKSIAYVVTIPVGGEAASDPLPLVSAALDDFERELRVFAAPPKVGRMEELPTYARVLRVEALVIPGRQAIVEGKLPARLAAALARGGHPLPPDTEVSVCLRSAGGREAPS
jgi:small conductance mechanosensitive channel